MAKEIILTPQGYKKLKEEIEHLSVEKRHEVAERIRTAREFGDIAENAEYDDAKNEQALLEHRIAILEERLRSAKVITKRDISTDVVSVGSHVRLRDVAAKKTFEYHIVGSAEADPPRPARPLGPAPALLPGGASRASTHRPGRPDRRNRRADANAAWGAVA